MWIITQFNSWRKNILREIIDSDKYRTVYRTVAPLAAALKMTMMMMFNSYCPSVRKVYTFLVFTVFPLFSPQLLLISSQSRRAERK